MSSLQFGLGDFAEGDPASAPATAEMRTPSIRPRRVRRGGHHPVIGVLTRRTPSIRPRRVRRGGPRPAARAPTCPPSFNSAPASSPGGATVEREPELLAVDPSIRPRRVRRGGRPVQPRRRRFGRPSIRPRRVRRGGLGVQQTESSLRETPSIRPRRLGRGGPLALQVQQFLHFEPRSASDTGYKKPIMLSMLMSPTVTDGPDTLSVSRAAWMPCRISSLSCQRTCDEKPRMRRFVASALVADFHSETIPECSIRLRNNRSENRERPRRTW